MLTWSGEITTGVWDTELSLNGPSIKRHGRRGETESGV